MKLPNKTDVATTWSETEAFEHADKLYARLITNRTPREAAEIFNEAESSLFRPATQLLLAGLTILGGRPFQKGDALVVQLSCFAVDHLLWGWTALVNAQPRVASTLSRAAVESTIFSIAAAEDFDGFQKIWKTREGTGGKILRSLTTPSADVGTFLDKLWNLVVPFGHASINPVLMSRGTFLDDSGKTFGISFAGQYAGPMDSAVLASMAEVYAFASVAAVEAMHLTLKRFFPEAERWDGQYSGLRTACYTRPIPPQLLHIAMRERG
jgi:hypothetical protein